MVNVDGRMNGYIEREVLAEVVLGDEEGDNNASSTKLSTMKSEGGTDKEVSNDGLR